VGWAQAYGRSINLPILNLARDLGDTAVVGPAQAFGFDVAMKPGLAHDLVTGEGILRPRRAMAAMQALRKGIAGEAPVAIQPYVVSAIRVGVTWMAPARAQGADLTPFVTSNDARNLLGGAAGSALGVSGGTLAGAVTPQAPVSPTEFGKTGTVAGPKPDELTIAKLVVGSGAGDAQAAYFGVMAAPRGGIGEKVSAIKLWAVLRRYAVAAAPGPNP
jgi:membrane peptidoglycan carboxypeptidase